MVAIRLKEIAEQKGKSMSQVQRQSGLTMGMVRRYWRNESQSIELSALDKLCYLLSVTPGDLIEFTPVTIHGHVTATLDDVTGDG